MKRYATMNEIVYDKTVENAGKNQVIVSLVFFKKKIVLWLNLNRIELDIYHTRSWVSFDFYCLSIYEYYNNRN